MQQVVDLQNDPNFQALNVQLLSVAFDSAAEQLGGMAEFGISDVPMLVDSSHEVAKAYDVLKWAVASGEPGHTFILVNAEGKIAWIRDYGAPNLADRTMYVPVNDLVSQIKANL